MLLNFTGDSKIFVGRRQETQETARKVSMLLEVFLWTSPVPEMRTSLQDVSQGVGDVSPGNTSTKHGVNWKVFEI